MFLRLLLYALLLCLLITGQADAQTHLDARLSASRVMAGDSLVLRLTARVPQTAILAEPQLNLPQGFEETLEILRAGSWDTLKAEGNQLILQRDFILMAWDSARLQIPPIALPWQLPGNEKVQVLHARPLNLEIRFPPPEKGTEIKPIRPIAKEPARWSDYLKPYMLIPLFLLLWLLAMWWRKYSERQIPEVINTEPPLPPHEYALQQLNLLAQNAPWKKGEVKAFHSALSHILRTYLEERFGIRALEETTPHILAQLQQSEVPQTWQQKIQALLQISDLVKFAKAQPQDDFHEKALEDVRAFIRETAPKENPEQNTTPTA